MTRIYLGLGSNINPEEHIPAGIESLKTLFAAVQVSPIYLSPAFGFEGDDFHNLVVIAETDLSAEHVIEQLRELEFQHGRPQNAEKYSSRTLDIDLLMYGDFVGEVCGYQIPRNDIYKFDFVLRPLADLVPAESAPGSSETFAELWQAMADASELQEVCLAE